jgi:hypothetical protein
MNPPDFASVVAKHWKETTAYIVTGREPCVSIGRDEVLHVERRLVPVAWDEVARLRPGRSWLMAVILCPGDDVEGLARWAASKDATRVHFYLHARAHLKQLAPWRDAGLPLDHVDDGVRSWGALHKVLGWDLNMQVYDDHHGP